MTAAIAPLRRGAVAIGRNLVKTPARGLLIVLMERLDARDRRGFPWAGRIGYVISLRASPRGRQPPAHGRQRRYPAASPGGRNLPLPLRVAGGSRSRATATTHLEARATYEPAPQGQQGVTHPARQGEQCSLAAAEPWQ